MTFPNKFFGDPEQSSISLIQYNGLKGLRGQLSWSFQNTCTDPVGGQEVRTPPPPPPPTPQLKNHKNIGLLSNIGPDHPEKLQLCQASIRCWAIISTPVKRRLNGGSIIGLLLVVFGSSHQLKKTTVKVGPPLTKLSGSPHE